nr:rho GTPase-activating protein 32-like isoform X2 [Lytechinus pictus]
MAQRSMLKKIGEMERQRCMSWSSPGSVASLAALRGKRLRKYSETDASTERLSSSIRSESGSSQLYTKVPLTPLALEDNVDYNFKRQASVRIKKMTSCHDGSTLFPKLNDCAHFHYDHVELGSIQISMHEESEDRTILEQNGGAVDLLDCPFTVRMLSQGKVWLLKRCYEDFRVLDKQLHKCIYDRRFSQLVELPKGETLTGREAVKTMLTHYVTRFSQIAGDMINCGPVLNWLEIDNIGCHIEVKKHCFLFLSKHSSDTTPCIH